MSSSRNFFDVSTSKRKIRLVCHGFIRNNSSNIRFNDIVEIVFKYVQSNDIGFIFHPRGVNIYNLQSTDNNNHNNHDTQNRSSVNRSLIDTITTWVSRSKKVDKSINTNAEFYISPFSSFPRIGCRWRQTDSTVSHGSSSVILKPFVSSILNIDNINCNGDDEMQVTPRNGKELKTFRVTVILRANECGRGVYSSGGYRLHFGLLSVDKEKISKSMNQQKNTTKDGKKKARKRILQKNNDREMKNNYNNNKYSYNYNYDDGKTIYLNTLQRLASEKIELTMIPKLITTKDCNNISIYRDMQVLTEFEENVMTWKKGLYLDCCKLGAMYRCGLHKMGAGFENDVDTHVYPEQQVFDQRYCLKTFDFIQLWIQPVVNEKSNQTNNDKNDKNDENDETKLKYGLRFTKGVAKDALKGNFNNSENMCQNVLPLDFANSDYLVAISSVCCNCDGKKGFHTDIMVQVFDN